MSQTELTKADLNVVSNFPTKDFQKARLPVLTTRLWLLPVKAHYHLGFLYIIMRFVGRILSTEHNPFD